MSKDYIFLCQLLDRIQYLSLPRRTLDNSFPPAADLFISNQDRHHLVDHRDYNLGPGEEINRLAVANQGLLDRISRIRDILADAFGPDTETGE